MLYLNGSEIEYLLSRVTGTETNMKIPEQYTYEIASKLKQELDSARVKPDSNITYKFLSFLNNNPTIILEHDNELPGPFKRRSMHLIYDDYLSTSDCNSTMIIEARQVYNNGYRTIKIFIVDDKFDVYSMLKDLGWYDIRICNMCGSPMTSGYTNSEFYICSDIEFVDMMTYLYGNYIGDGSISAGWANVEEDELEKFKGSYKQITEDGTVIDI